MKNPRQSGSRTKVTAKVLDEGASPNAPAAFVFTFERDEGSYCKLWGLCFQLDSGRTDLTVYDKRFLGKAIQVTAEVIDSTNAKASSTKAVRIAYKLCCPDGATNCNDG
jgi:hypothetical protein